MFSKLLLFGAGDWTQSLTHEATQVVFHETVYLVFDKKFFWEPSMYTTGSVQGTNDSSDPETET